MKPLLLRAKQKALVKGKKWSAAFTRAPASRKAQDPVRLPTAPCEFPRLRFQATAA